MKFKVLACILIICLALSLCGCTLASQLNVTAVNKDSENVLHLALSEDIFSPDVQTGGSSQVAANIYNKLVKFSENEDGSFSVTGDLAESWDISTDGLTYTFHLKDGVLFHNGEEFEAEDVLYTIDRFLDAENGSVYNQAADYISFVDVVDKYTVNINLKRLCPEFLACMCDPVWSMYNADAKEAGAYSIGTGPYIFEDWVAGEYVFLKVNDYYFEGKASIDGILYSIVPSQAEQLAMFNHGELDALFIERDEELADVYLNDENCSQYVVAKRELNTYFYSMNQNLAPFTGVSVRKGLQRSLDRKVLLAEFSKGQGSVLNGIMPVTSSAYNQTLPRIKYNLADAKELFADGGYTEAFSLTICQTGTDEKENALNTLAAEQFCEAGINASVKEMDPATYYSAMAAGNLSMHLCCIKSDLNDPSSFIDKAFGSIENVRYSMNISDTELLKRIEKASSITDINKRNEEYRAIEEILVDEDAVIIPLFQLYTYVLVNPRVENFSAENDCIYSFSLYRGE